ncbi:MAG: hypothetical protein ACE5FO_05380 [Parvularculaceae bacterium]
MAAGLAYFCGATSALGHEHDAHLIPEDSVFSQYYFGGAVNLSTSYYLNVLDALNDAYAHGVFARAIVIPSFQNEYAVAIAKSESSYRIIHIEVDTHLWLFESLEDLKSGAVRIVDDDDGSKLAAEIRELEEYLPESPEDVSVTRCVREIPSQLGKDLYVLWADMLYRTRYPDKRPVNPDDDIDDIVIGVDGITYHFSFEYSDGRLTGKVWSPDKDSSTGKFVAITNLLRKACHAPDGKKILDEIDRQIGEMNQELSKSAY